MIKKILNWIWYSSADPAKVSLTMKSFLLGLVPLVISIAGIAHLNLDQETVTMVFESVVVVVQSVLTIISAVGFVIGLIRKIFFPKVV
jgi:hypothetical protein